MAAKLFLGSLDLTKIVKTDIKDGKYLSVSIWLNDNPDKYGNNISIKAGGKDNSYYIGNAKEWSKEPKKVEKEKDLPF